MARVNSKSIMALQKSEHLLFWIVVRACRDLMTAHVPNLGDIYVSVEDYASAHEWIIEDEPQDVVIELLDDGKAIVREMRFSDALGLLGVNPENVSVLRDALMSAAGKVYKERSAYAKKAYQDLHFHEHKDHDPWWRSITNNIITPDEEY